MTPTQMDAVLAFRLDDRLFACRLNDILRVIWAVEITPLPGQKDKVKGVINVEEVIIPVVNLRRIVGFPERELELDDDIIVVNSDYGPVGMIVDNVQGINDFFGAEVCPITSAISSYASAVLKSETDLIVVIDPSKMVCASDLPDIDELSQVEIT